MTQETGVIRVQFALLPIEAWSRLPNDVKRRFHITKGAGVSILRADREIAYGWLLFGGKKRENYDDWWRAEVSFPPSLDGTFGVTHTKQGVRPSAELFDALVPTLEAQAHRLNRLVRHRFEALRKGTNTAELRAEKRHARLANPEVQNRVTSSKKSLRGVRYRLLFEDSHERPLARTVTRASLVSVYVNRLHPFYTKLYIPLSRSGCEDAILALESFLLAFGRASGAQNVVADEFLARLSDASAVFMESL
jgi:hypothetical protein